MLPFSKSSCLFEDESIPKGLQEALDHLSLEKMTFEAFLEIVKDPRLAARIASRDIGRTLLHLAIVENRLDVVDLLKNDSLLQLRQDIFGLSPIDLAHFLHRKEALHLLKPRRGPEISPGIPEGSEFESILAPFFETVEDLNHILSTVKKAKANDLIPPEKVWMGIYYDKELRSHKHPPIFVNYIDDSIGFGVFAKEKIAACTFVGEYAGVIQQRSMKQLRDKKYALRYTVWEGKKNYAIDAENKGNFTRFINHSSKPNLGLHSVYWRGLPRMIFIALREIQAEEQLTFDYGPLYWKYESKVPVDL